MIWRALVKMEVVHFNQWVVLSAEGELNTDDDNDGDDTTMISNYIY